MKQHFKRHSFVMCLSMKTLIFLLLVLLGPSGLNAQNYSIDWFKIAGGGGTSTNGSYSMSGTIGQHDAGGIMSGGSYSLVGGFWALPVLVQSSEAPTLYVTNGTPGSATIRWSPAGTVFVLQTSDSLSPSHWVNASSGTNNPVSVPATLPVRFYRLFRP